MIDLKTYDPCGGCHFKLHPPCPIVRPKAHNCPAVMIHEALLMGEAKMLPKIPDELFMELLRQRGWHGELKQIQSVRV